MSDMLPTPFGVSQGSVLGQLLFTVSTTPLSLVIQSHNLDHNLDLYSGDTTLFFFDHTKYLSIPKQAQGLSPRCLRLDEKQ